MTRIANDELAALLSQTYSADSRERAEAVRLLCPCHVKRNEPRVWDRIISMANDPDAKVRSQVLHVLADGSPREREGQVVSAIQAIAYDEEESLRRRARKVLAQYRRSGSINVL